MVCGHCERSLPCDPGLDGALCAFAYRFPVDRLVQRFKFAGDLAVGRWLGERLAQTARHATRPDILVAPPLSRRRLRERGFNQSLELARVAGRALDLPVEFRAMARVRDTAPQPGLGRDQRRENVRDAFTCDFDFRGRTVAIVDDVITTGATVAAFARALHLAGAVRVEAWVVARAPAPARMSRWMRPDSK